MKRIGSGLAIALLSAGMVAGSVVYEEAEARRGGGFGSRGSRTWAAPPVTQTAPRPAQPIERSAAPRPAPGQAAAPGAAPRPGLFGSGLGGTLMRGLLIGGLIGMLLGGGLGGFAGFLGLVLQLGLLALGIMLVMRFLARRRQGTGTAVPAGARNLQPDLAGQERQAREPRGNGLLGALGGSLGGGLGSGLAGALGGGLGGGSRPANALNAHDTVGIEQGDLDTFERMLSETQAAFAAGDTVALSRLATPEVTSQFQDELRNQEAQGIRNEVTDIHLLQGDLAEAWSEGGRDYATVALRYESRDVMRDAQTGTVVSGSADAPTETTEVWTFTRPRGGRWQLAAIQDA